MSFLDRFRSPQKRSAYDRSTGNMLINEPQIVWVGSDMGGGRSPIGPNGPFAVETLPAITRLTSIITDPLSASPWTVAESTTGLPRAGQPVAPPRWMVDPQLMRPDARYQMAMLPAARRLPRSTFWATWIRSAVWFGTGYLMFIEDANGQPLPGTLELLNPRAVRNVTNNAGVRVWEVGDEEDGFDPVLTDRDGYLPFSVRTRIVALRDPHAPLDAEGRSIGLFERHRDTFGLARNIQNYTSGVYRSGIPSGYLKVTAPNFDGDMAAELKERWLAAHGGDRRSIAVLNATTEFQPIQFSPHDAALTEGKRANLADMAMAFSLDPTGALGVDMGSSMTYANVGQHFQRLQQDLLPWITAVEQTIGSLLRTGRDMRIDFSDLTRPDPTQQIAMLNTAVQSGLLTVDEGRAQIGLPPIATPIEGAPK